MLCGMKIKVFSILFTCAAVVFLFEFGSSLPRFLTNVLLPGFLVVAMINGSFHDRMMPGYAVFGVILDCVFYCTLVSFGIWLLKRLRKS